MDVAEVLARVEALRAEGDDSPETTHIAEDELLADVLRAIADGEENASGLAATALLAVNDERTRWYA